MASANTDAWDRDHAADANPDLTRKRPRLSEELQPSPSPSSAADDHAVILQVQDDTMAMPRLSDHFLLDSSIHVSATQQLQGLLKQVHGNDYMSLSWFEYLSAWMYQHVNDLTDQDRLRDAYFDDLDFFAHLGLLCYAIMERQDDLFEDVHLSPREVAHITQSVENFCHAAMVLAVRMLSYLPSLVDTAVSRRDSAQTSNTRHNIDLLYWVQVLAQVASLHNAPQLTKYFYLQLDYKPKRAAGTFRRDLVDTQQPLDYLLQLLEKLSDNHRQIVNSWIALDAIIHILNSLNLGARKETELVLETIHMYLLPTACEKHPRSLPENFHDLLVETAGNAIEHLSQNAGDTAIASLYDRYIKDELDGLLPTSGSDSQVCQRLQQISAGDPDVRTELMLTAWILQAFRSFIYSDIMDVRNCGIALLSKRLVTLHKKHNPHNDCPDHPVLQYVARFLRTNELPKYIFGPNSHSSIVHHSQHIISFLAVNAAYTNLETDIIWHACAYSVEAEFVKSSFAVLNEVVNFLNLEQLLYLANKYAITPPTKLGKHAVDFLTRIFQRIQVKSDEGSERHERLATAFICIDIMMQVGQTEENLLLNKLRETARNELFRFANPSFSPEDRVQICSRCLPNIIDHSEHATVSVDILVMFLRNLVSIQEAQQLLSLLSVSSVIDGLVRYVNDRHAAGRTIGLADLCGIDVRIESILHLMALSGTQPDEDDVRKFYQHTVGELALGNEARDRAWMLLTHMGNIQNLSLVASTLLQRFLAQDTINLAVCFMTPQLLGLFAEQLKAQAASEFEFSTILDTPIWKKLLETAEHESITPATQQAARIIIHLLFEYGQRTHSAEVISRCHASFAKQQIRRICDNFASLPHLVSSRERIVAIDREISLLDAVMAQSKATPVASSGEVDRELRLVDSGVEKPTHFKLQVYGAGQSPPAVYLVVASESTLLSELTTRLPDITGASQIRVIIGGKPVDLASNATESISRLGLDKSGVIHVCPKYSPQSDLAKVLKPPGVIEQEIGEHYTELDGLLDGPDAISQKMLVLLSRVSPPPQVRRLVSSEDITAPVLCPPDQMRRSMLNILMLHKHLIDYTKLGVIDQRFIERSIRILVAVLTDSDCSKHMDVRRRAMEVLTAFLQEQPQNSGASFVEPDQFASCMVTFCQDAINRSDEHGSESRMLIQSAFTLLHQTFRREEAVWKCFTKDPRVSDLHALILFHMNPFLAADASTMIENFCMDSTSPPEVADFYMNVVLGIVPRALVYPDRATQFFELGTGLLLHNSILRHDESRARGVTNSLIETLFTYEHAESVDLPIVDRVLSGLLRLLIESITVVRSFKKNLRVEGLATRLFCSLLFPDPSDTHARPLVHVETRRLAYGLARAVCETKQDFMGVLKSLRPALYETHSTPHARYPGVSNWLRPAYMCSGLENLGMTCYMNSLLQQLFANVQFRAFILDTEIVDDERQTLLFQLQALFARMQNSSAPCADTAALARVLDIQTDSQEDVHGFYADFLSRLETNMPDETSKATLRNFFTGKLISQIKGECGHVSPRTEPFVDLPMLVKNKAGLHDSLDEFVQGEPMEGSNQYKCQACDPADGGRLVNAMRRSCPEEMPDNLTFCLKRFTFEAMLGLDGKVNDRFEFPQSIDMSRYCRAHLEDPKAEIKEDHFELVGVIVHQGTLQLGHYWSYTLLRNTGDPYARNWVKLEDKNVSTCSGGIDDVQRECFGGLRYTNGLERADNAYVLFYQRQSSLEAQLSVPGPIVDPSTQIPFPPRVKIPDVHQQPIHHDNAWRRRIANLFHYDLLSMMEWILVHCKRFGFNSSAPSDSSSDNSAESSPQSDVDASESPKVVGEPVMDDLVQLVGEVVFLFIQRVGVCDMTPETKLAPCISGLERLIADQPRLGLVILEHMTRDPFWFQASLLHQSDHVRSTMNKLIWTCLWALSGREKTAHRAMVTRLRQMHAQLLTSESKTLRELNWSDYLGFAAEMAKISPQDTAAILDEGYWEWASDMINLPWDSTIRKKYPGLHDHLKTRPDQFSAVYDFLRSLLEEHVTIPNPEDFTPPDGPHVVTDEGKVLLRLKEVHTFVWPLWQRGTRTVFNWLRSAKYADQDGNWRISAPGRLLGALMEKGVPVEITDGVEISLTTHVEDEEHSLAALLHLVIHYCIAANVSSAIQMMTAMLKTMSQWEDQEGELITVIVDAYQEAPLPILSTLEHWVKDYLSSKAYRVRQPTADFLQKQIFGPPFELEKPNIESLRSRHARWLIKYLGPLIQAAYRQERPRTKYEDMIRVLSEADLYLQDLLRVVGAKLFSQDKAGPPAVLEIEYYEAKTALSSLAQLNSNIADWEPPQIASLDISRSVEPGSDLDGDDEDEDEEEEWSSDDSRDLG